MKYWFPSGALLLFGIISAAQPVGAAPDQIVFVKCVQAALGAMGFDAGPIDGQSGPSTANAAKQYSESLSASAIGWEEEVLSAQNASRWCEGLLTAHQEVLLGNNVLREVFYPQGGSVSPLVAKNLTKTDERQALNILGVMTGIRRQDFHLTSMDAVEISKILGREVSQDAPFDLRDLERLEQLLSSARYWPRANVSVISENEYTIDPKTLSVDGELCGGGGFEMRDLDGRQRLFGNEGIVSHASPVGDVDGDGNDDLIVAFFRGQWSGGLDREKKERYYSRPSILTWDGSKYVTHPGLSESLADTVLPRHIEYADFNNDGLSDFYVADAGFDGQPECGYQNALYANRSGETFERIVPDEDVNDYSHGLTVADFDGDGDQDIAVINSPHANKKKMGECKGIYDVPSVIYSYFLENQGDFKFLKRQMPFDSGQLFYSAEGVSADSDSEAYLILGRAGTDWRDDSRPSLDIYRVGKNFELRLESTIKPPSGFPSDLFSAEIIMADVDSNASKEIIASWQFMTAPVDELGYHSPNGRVGGGRYIQVIAEPFSENPIDITETIFAEPPLLNIRGEGAWCVELYASDIDGNGTTDLACSTYDQWRRVGGRITPYGEEMPVLYLNNGEKLVGNFLGDPMDMNKWLIPVDHGGNRRVAQLEPFSCSAAKSVVLEIAP